MDISGVPLHLLQLKIGAIVILMRNLDAPRLCDGTRLRVDNIGNNIITWTIITGIFKGDSVIIPRIPIIPTDLPFQFRRLQFPIKLAFSITINKSQGQTLKFVGLNLQTQCFSHGKLYVGCSRVSTGKNLYMYAPKGVRNIVYENALK